MSTSRPSGAVRAVAGALLTLALAASGAAAGATAASASAPAATQIADDEVVRDFVGVAGDAFNGGTDFRTTAQIRTLGGSNYLAVRVLNTDTETLTIAVSSVYGEQTRRVEPGASYYQSFPMRTTEVPLTRLSVGGWVEDDEGQMVRGSSAEYMNVVLPQG